MDNKLFVCSSPHLRDNSTTKKLMLDVIIALMPATVMGIYFFNINAVRVILATVIASVLAEYVTRRVMKREQTISDLSAVVTGLLLALNLPSTIPTWIAAVGGVIAIVIVKQLFGGIGQNFMNPALGARVILLVSWAGHMTNWVTPGADAVSSATPLALIKAGKEAAAGAQLTPLTDLFFGNIAGSLGETSALALILGGLYLLYRKVITIEIPLIYILSVGVLTWILGNDGLFTGNFLYHIFAGGLMIGAFFMATDYSSTPVTYKGRVIFAVGCGVLTAVIRLYTNYPEGVSFAIILMNIVTPLIDRYTIPVSFGGEKNAA